MILFLILLISLLLLVPLSSVGPSAGYRRHHCREGRFRNSDHRL